MPGVDLSAEATRAGVYIAGSAAFLKLMDALIQWRHGSRVDRTSDLDITVQRGAQLREELRKDLEVSRQREDSLEGERDELEKKLRVAVREREMAVNECEDLRAEKRLFWRKGKDAE